MLWRQDKINKSKNLHALPDISLNGFRIIVRTIRMSDQQNWIAVRTRNKNRLQPLEPKWAKDALSEDFFIRRLQRQIKNWVADRAYCFVIEDKSDNKIIGGINLNNIVRGAAHHASLGYWIDEACEGQGYMGEAAQLLFPYAFKELKLKRINAASLPDNRRSIRLLQKLGFEEEGYAKKYLQINGTRQDHILFGLSAP